MVEIKPIEKESKMTLDDKKTELLKIYGKYLDKNLLNDRVLGDTLIHTLYHDLITNNESITINIGKNENFSF